MSKLSKYSAESNIMNVEIEYNGESFKFNLDRELRIKDSNRDNEIRNHARSYAFLCMLNVKLTVVVKELHKELKSTFAKRLTKLRESSNSVKEAELGVYNDKFYVAKQSEVTRAEELKQIIEVSVRAFEERKDLLQTLSANTRRENKS